jgi:hypothetical protein
LAPFFPGFTLRQIKSRARSLGPHKNFHGEADVSIVGNMKLIRIRAKQDGIALIKIDDLLKTRSYFTTHWKKRSRANLSAVAKAVEYFGGTLVIDWRDR